MAGNNTWALKRVQEWEMKLSMESSELQALIFYWDSLKPKSIHKNLQEIPEKNMQLQEFRFAIWLTVKYEDMDLGQTYNKWACNVEHEYQIYKLEEFLMSIVSRIY